MSKFYGTIKGASKTEATRRGYHDIKVAAQSWNGSLITSLWYNDTNELMVDLSYNEGSASCGHTIFSGSMTALLERLGN